LVPFGLKNPLKVYIDVSLKENEFITVPAGIKNLVVQVKPEDIEKVTGAEWIDICKN